MESLTKNCIKEILELNVNLNQAGDADLRAEIFRGFKENPKTISSKFFYDKRGSELFEEITQLEEYYPSRTEKSILKENASEIMQKFRGDRFVELGSGDCSKISILLEACPFIQREQLTYIPVDVSESAIYHSAKALSEVFPEVKVRALVSDFILQDIEFEDENEDEKMFSFLGSTIGNLLPDEAKNLVSKISRWMKKGDSFLLGMDMVKDTEVLNDAYNDKRGVTADFNTNILYHINSICRSNIQEKYFKHIAFYNEELSRIEMHLRVEKPFKIGSPFWPESICFDEGELIHTENSHKYTNESIQELICETDLEIEKIYTDDKNWFSLVLLKKTIE